MTGAERFRPANRLARSSDLRHCLLRGKRLRTDHLEVIWTESTAGHPRMGLIVPKFQSSAVARNRLRRRLREVWRREVLARQPDWDVILRARREAYAASFSQLRSELLKWRDTVLPPG